MFIKTGRSSKKVSNSSPIQSPIAPTFHHISPRISVTIVKAKGLLGKDSDGKSDPFVTLTTSFHKFRTAVIKNSLNPVWNQTFHLDNVADQPPHLFHFKVYDSDIIGKDFLGETAVSSQNVLEALCNPESPKIGSELESIGPDHVSFWLKLSPSSSKPKEKVEGDIHVSFKVSGINPSALLDEMQKMISGSFGSVMNSSASTVSSGEDDERRRVERRHSLDSASKLRAPHRTSSATSLKTLTLDGTKFEDPETTSVLLIWINSCSCLPKAPGATSISYDMDPFVVVSFGDVSFRTKTVTHSRNPVFNELVFFKVRPDQEHYPVKFSVYDWDFTTNDHVGHALATLETLGLAEPCPNSVARCDCRQLSPVVAASKEDDVFRNITLLLNLSNKMKAYQSEAAQITLRSCVLPFAQVRKRFWLSLMQCYDSDENKKVNFLELECMLQSVLAAYTEEQVMEAYQEEGKDPSSELPFEEAAAICDRLVVGNRDHRKRHFDAMTCPICTKPSVRKMSDMDFIIHISICAMMEPQGIDRIIMRGFITETVAQRSVLEKVSRRVGFGRYHIGADNANILVRCRQTGHIIEERIPSFIRLGIRLLYKMRGSKQPIHFHPARKLLASLSIKQGRRYNDPTSVRDIRPFINFHNLDMSEVLEPIENFNTFNEFFYRKLKPNARTIASKEPFVAVSPADCRCVAFQTIGNAQELWIKGAKFTIGRLLGDPRMERYYRHGSVAIFRLAPQDYHRFHIPVDGILSAPKEISGQYYTVNPMAVRSETDVYIENRRTVSYIDSALFGKVAYVAVGAMMVGSINLTSKPGSAVKRMDEHGYFAFGGSTIVLLFRRGSISFDADLLDGGHDQLETLVRMGNSIGNALEY